MSEIQNRSGVREIPGRLLKVTAYLGGGVLFVIMLFVSWSVFCRYILNEPILGDQEIVEIGMSLVVMLAMPFATFSSVHIRVDVLDNKLGAMGRFLGDLFARGIACFVLYLLIGKTTDKMFDAYKYDDVTNMIEIPVWIAYAAATLGMGLMGVVFAAQLVLQLRKGVARYE